MPKKPRRPCGAPGCPRLAEEGGQYCGEHRLQYEQRYNKFERAPDINKNTAGRGSVSVTVTPRRTLCASIA